MNKVELIAKLKDLKKEQQHSIDYYAEEINRIQHELDSLPLSDCSAANAWCRLTNALIRKYKTTAEISPVQAIKEITQIEGCLLTGGFLTKEELEDAL